MFQQYILFLSYKNSLFYLYIFSTLSVLKLTTSMCTGMLHFIVTHKQVNHALTKGISGLLFTFNLILKHFATNILTYKVLELTFSKGNK